MYIIYNNCCYNDFFLFGEELLDHLGIILISFIPIMLNRYGGLAAFLAALTPFLPDDVVIILLGVAKYSPWKFVITNFAGKLVANEVIVWGVIFLRKQKSMWR